MQATPQAHHAFPLGRTLAVLSAMAVVVLAVELALVPWLFGWPQGGMLAVLLMGTLVWAANLLAVLPMAREQGRGPLAVVKVFFIGMAVRALVAVVAIIITVKRFALPMGPTAVATMMMYLPLLFVETRMLADYVRKYDALGPGPSDKGGHQGHGDDQQKSDAKPQAAGDRENRDETTAPCTEALA